MPVGPGPRAQARSARLTQILVLQETTSGKLYSNLRRVTLRLRICAPDCDHSGRNHSGTQQDLAGSGLGTVPTPATPPTPTTTPYPHHRHRRRRGAAAAGGSGRDNQPTVGWREPVTLVGDNGSGPCWNSCVHEKTKCGRGRSRTRRCAETS